MRELLGGGVGHDAPKTVLSKDRLQASRELWKTYLAIALRNYAETSRRSLQSHINKVCSRSIGSGRGGRKGQGEHAA